MRGKPVADVMTEVLDGLIPAHAGKTGGRGRRCLLSGAHPRACGENLPYEYRGKVFSGSSPRMRGKREQDGLIGPETRLIPAHAGKTGSLRNSSRAWWAHPRACGENRTGKITMPYEEGSSPRMRGKPVSVLCTSCIWGLIPAHAGKTGPWRRKCRRWGAHPRACGENLAWFLLM